MCDYLFMCACVCLYVCISVCACVQRTLCLLMFREKGNNVRNALGDSHIDYGFLILLQSTFDTFHYDYLGDIDHWMKNVHHLSMLVHAYHNWIKGWPRISFPRIGSSLVIHRTWILTSESKSQKIYTMINRCHSTTTSYHFYLNNTIIRNDSKPFSSWKKLSLIVYSMW